MKEHQFATPLLPNRLIEHRLKQEPVARAMLYPGDVRPLGLRLFCLQIASLSRTCPILFSCMCRFLTKRGHLHPTGLVAFRAHLAAAGARSPTLLHETLGRTAAHRDEDLAGSKRQQALFSDLQGVNFWYALTPAAWPGRCSRRSSDEVNSFR